MSKEQPVKTSIRDEGPFDGAERREHPAFGQIGLYRGSGNAKLYGSAIDKHSEYIALRVHASYVEHHLGRDWYHTQPGLPLIELKLSAAQFADMITGLNVGSGVPCTLDFVNGKEVPRIPWDQPTESTKVVDSFKREVADKVEALKGEVERLVEIVNHKKALNQADRKDLVDTMNRFAKLFYDSAPFMVDSFSEAAEKVVTHAKAEVEAFVHRVTVETGITALREKAEEQRQLVGEKK